jgi:hypothetical protein
MGPVANFILALVVATVTIAGGSLAWPRITTQPRPKLLQDVKNIVIKTSVGKETANVLGVSDEAHVAPINLGQVAAGAAGQVKTMIQNRVQAIIVGNAVNQLHQQFERLSPDQKKQIQQSICQPLEKK